MHSQSSKASYVTIACKKAKLFAFFYCSTQHGRTITEVIWYVHLTQERVTVVV